MFSLLIWKVALAAELLKECTDTQGEKSRIVDVHSSWILKGFVDRGRITKSKVQKYRMPRIVGRSNKIWSWWNYIAVSGFYVLFPDNKHMRVFGFLLNVQKARNGCLHLTATT